jgi:hypothetical protein
MIDTDKYEGHLLINGEFSKQVMPPEQYYATKALLNDAPLLLDFIVWVKNTHPHYYHRLTKAYQNAKNNR